MATDPDGVTHIQKRRASPGRWLIGLALAFTAVCGALCVWLLWPEAPAPVPVAPPRPVARAVPPPESSPARAPAPPPTAAALPASAEPPPPEAAPAQPAEGVHLYRPGTKPLKQGLVVPEGYELPPGFVRHYQTTDEGQAVKPILMFHPDYRPVDANGQPVELPANRVVPMELAPPGMPLEVLELPAGPEGVEPLP